MIEPIQSAFGLNPQGGGSLVLYRLPPYVGHPPAFPVAERTFDPPGEPVFGTIYIDLHEPLGYSQKGCLRYLAQTGVFLDVYC
jgi:hypothetical protein